MPAAAPHTLAGVLGLGRRELVALVGGGGKTTALLLLAGELASAGSRLIATTTTGMFLRELAVVGPVVMDVDDRALIHGLRAALAERRVAGAARSAGPGGKVAGLPPGTVDAVWGEGLADYLLVEADGSRGMSLKAFAPHEPQVPAATTTIVQVAGLDAIGRPLTAEHVHRAEVLAGALGVPLGAEVTARVFAKGLRRQLTWLRQAHGASRVVTVLNKADRPGSEAAALDALGEVLADRRSRGRATGSRRRVCPDVVVMGSLREGRFARLATLEE